MNDNEMWLQAKLGERFAPEELSAMEDEAVEIAWARMELEAL